MLQGISDVKVAFEQAHRGVMMGVKNARFGFVHTLPAAIKNTFGNSEILENLEILGEVSRFPNAAPYCGIRVRKMIKAVTLSIPVSRIFHNPLLPVHCIENVLAFQG